MSVYVFVFILICLELSVTKSLPIRVVDNGYEGIIIKISPNIAENQYPALVDRIKTIFTEASKFLYQVTKNHLYFKDITIVIPENWSKKNEYETVSGYRNNMAHVIIDKPNLALGDAPYVHGLTGCGVPARYMHLTPHLTISEDGAGFCDHDRILIHEWGHLRWGLFDEYPTVEKASENPQEEFYSANGAWEPNSCSGSIIGRNLKDCSDLNSGCSLDENGKPELGCRFCPFVPNIARASVMGYQWLESIVEFCDKDDTNTSIFSRHNSKARNNQNIFCDGKSAWEVMREHEDFIGLSQGSENQNTTPVFRVVQPSAQKVVLVLDVSGSMRGEPLEQLRKAVSHFLLNTAVNGSYIGIVTFSGVASVVKNITRITSEGVRDDIIKFLPSSAGGPTSIGAGLQRGLEALKLQTQEVEGSIIYLVSDGKETRTPYIDDVKSDIINEGVVIHTLAYGEEADEGMEALASSTGGSSFFYSGDTNSTALIDAFSDASLVGTTDTLVMIDSRMIQVSEGNPYVGEFVIDSDSNLDTTLQLVGQDLTNVDITVMSFGGGPTINLQYNVNDGGKKIKINGNIQAGKYTYYISGNSSAPAILTVQSYPSNSLSDPVRLQAWLSADVYNYSAVSFLTLYTSVQKGTTAVLGAIVTAEIEDGSAVNTVLVLKDNGGGADLIEDDGIYTAMILPWSIHNKGRHSIKVKVTNNDRTAYILMPSGEPAIQVPNTPVMPITVQRNYLEAFQRISQAGDFKVINFIEIITEDKIPPATIKTLELSSVDSNLFTIKWKAVGDSFDIGTASAYDVRISTDFDLLRSQPNTVSKVTENPPQPGATGTLETMVVNVSDSGQTYYLTIRAVDDNGNVGDISNIVSLSVLQDRNWQQQTTSPSPPSLLTKDDATIIIGISVAVGFLVIIVIAFIIVSRHVMLSNSKKKRLKSSNLQSEYGNTSNGTDYRDYRDFNMYVANEYVYY